MKYDKRVLETETVRKRKVAELEPAGIRMLNLSLGRTRVRNEDIKRKDHVRSLKIKPESLCIGGTVHILIGEWKSIGKT